MTEGLGLNQKRLRRPMLLMGRYKVDCRLRFIHVVADRVLEERGFSNLPIQKVSLIQLIQLLLGGGAELDEVLHHLLLVLDALILDEID